MLLIIIITLSGPKTETDLEKRVNATHPQFATYMSGSAGIHNTKNKVECKINYSSRVHILYEVLIVFTTN